MKPGQIIKSSSQLDGSYFENSRILIAEYNEKGALGFLLNRPFSRSLNELVEFRHSPPFPLFEGGPVDQEHLFIVHRRPDLIAGSRPVNDKLFIGGDMNAAVKYINNKTLQPGDIFIFVGYCGWNKGELDAEMEEGSWFADDGSI
ncbi:MAG: YqgE/AlgH family protein [Chitinophagaceae bacterium]